MAEKEERISVIIYEKDPCENCPGNPMTDCQVCEKDLRYDGGMTRQEAIEKMAKAMCHSPSGTCEDCFARESKKACKQAMFGMKELAEAALNALLEGK